ncbi:PhoH family protein [bacterium]|nr:PhoH family protein [bacterium]
MTKFFVLDTNVILYDPQAILKFGKGNEVVIPITVIEEVDRFKKDQNENGRNARHFSRMIDELRNDGHLAEGVNLSNGGRLSVGLSQANAISQDLFENTADHRILSVAYTLMREHGSEAVHFVTKDINLRIKADALGIPSEDYDSSGGITVDELYSGIGIFEVSAADITTFYADKKLHMEDPSVFPNQFIILRDQANASHSAIGRFDVRQGAVVPLIRNTEGVWGLHPKNVEQSFALDLLLNDDIQLVSLVGKAGTGKTLMALAAGLHKTLDEGRYQKLLVSRPIFPLGKDVGYLPGDIEQKLNPWMQPIFDNIEFLMGGAERSHRRSAARSVQELISQGMLNIEPLTYIRGRSIPNQFLIVDEAQNLTPHEIKTILTRAGDNTKIVLTGDPYQIDNPYVDSASNGLAHVIERFKGEDINGTVNLVKGERSPLAELASNLL